MSLGDEPVCELGAGLVVEGAALVVGEGELPGEAQALRTGARTVSKMRGRIRRTHG